MIHMCITHASRYNERRILFNLHLLGIVPYLFSLVRRRSFSHCEFHYEFHYAHDMYACNHCSPIEFTRLALLYVACLHGDWLLPKLSPSFSFPFTNT